MASTYPTISRITYTQLRDGSWGLRGAGLTSGRTVTVTKRDGSTKIETVGRVLWTGDGVVLATISSSRSSTTGQRRSYDPDRHRCHSCGHTGDECADLDCTCRSCGGMMR